MQIHNYGLSFDDASPNLEYVAPCSVYVVVDGERTCDPSQGLGGCCCAACVEDGLHKHRTLSMAWFTWEDLGF